MIGDKQEKKQGCDFLVDELSDIKRRLDEDAEKEFADEVSDNVSSHLRDISNLIDSKLEFIGQSCGLKGTAESHYGKVRTEGVPYSSTPM